jgi:hypothetical protein
MRAIAAAVLLISCGRAADPVAPGTTYTVAVEVRGPGRVLSLPPGIDCPGICTADFARGTGVTLAAAPAQEGVFREWVGACSGATGCMFELTRDGSVVARFDPM